jgi:cholesterol oxidase
VDAPRGYFSRPHLFDPGAPPRARRPLRAAAAEVIPCTTADGKELRLTRHRGGSRGPVILTHGLGVSSLTFAIDTIPTNLVEYLCERGFDVWLLDYRASIALPCSRELYTADHVAHSDYPAAVAAVRQATGAPSVQIVGHCFGGVTLFMAIAAGLQGVRSAVFSQVAVHILMPAQNRIKSMLRTPTLLRALGMRTFDAYVDVNAGLPNALLDEGLKLYTGAFGAYCGSPVCRRITFMFGPLYRHARLNEATHAALHEMFGVASLRAFEHFVTMADRGHVVTATGDDGYLPHLDRFAFPIAFVHGAENECYLPKSTALTYARLCEANGARWYRRDVIPDYGHLDCLFGTDAARDVYPLIADHLAAT